jgi:L-Ala-D/L-Glu epimerase
MTANPYAIESIEVIPVRPPLREPFVISYATYPDILSVLVRLRTAEGVTGWGEATPDPNVTGETWEGVTETLRHHLAPSLIGFDIRDREAMHAELERRVAEAPAAKAALDIALHDALGHLMGQPVYTLLGGRTKPFLTISRVVSMKSPDEMARDAQRHLADCSKQSK